MAYLQAKTTTLILVKTFKIDFSLLITYLPILPTTFYKYEIQNRWIE